MSFQWNPYKLVKIQLFPHLSTCLSLVEHMGESERFLLIYNRLREYGLELIELCQDNIAIVKMLNPHIPVNNWFGFRANM